MSRKKLRLDRRTEVLSRDPAPLCFVTLKVFGVTEDMAGRTQYLTRNDSKQAQVGNAQSDYESENGAFPSVLTAVCFNVLDIADIVKDQGVSLWALILIARGIATSNFLAEKLEYFFLMLS
jgi:hypothetical protein